MPSLPGKRGAPKAGARDLAFGSKGNQKKLSEEMKRGSKQWKKVVEGMKSASREREGGSERGRDGARERGSERAS